MEGNEDDDNDFLPGTEEFKSPPFHLEPLMLPRLEDEIVLRLRDGMDVSRIGNVSSLSETVERISNACEHNKLLLRRVESKDLPSSLPIDVREAIVDALRAPIRECSPVLAPVPITPDVLQRAASGNIRPAEVRVDSLSSRRAFLTGDDIRAFIQLQVDQSNIRMVDALDEQRAMIVEQRYMLQLQRQTIDQLSASHAALQALVAHPQRVAVASSVATDDDEEEKRPARPSSYSILRRLGRRRGDSSSVRTSR